KGRADRRGGFSGPACTNREYNTHRIPCAWQRQTRPMAAFRLIGGSLADPEACGKVPLPAHSAAFRRRYLISAVAPASFSLAAMLSASSLLTFSLTGLGAASTRSLASFRPRPVISRTALITLILLSPTWVRVTVNSVCSSAASGSAAGPAAGPAAGAA